MKRTIKIAAVQMDANPTPTADRLARADRLVTDAAEAGAQLVVLPELFNTGYAYSDANHRLAEPLNDPTATWMKETAARLNVHLAGSLMLLDQDEVYNALLLFAPDGRMWRYDKNYPWGWERGYFRDGNRITVAETDLGDIGMMICWDTAHTQLWRRHAGRVDLMLIASCPPDVSNPTFHFPDGDALTFDDMGPLMGSLKGSARLVFDDMINQQAAWLDVPAVNTVGCGRIRTAIPNGRASFLTFLFLSPWLVRYLPQASQMQMSCDMTPGCKVVDANGCVLAELTQEQGETFTVAEVTLADEKPRPRGPQPASPVPFLSYFSSDVLLPSLTVSVYRKGLRRAWGERMAPVEASTRKWGILLGLGAVVGFLLSLFWGRRKNKRRH
ncbi:MAG: carbon-nitrogen hydrolase family protein [Chloroflexi bacterium]|nr:carbon-nitrogen hydrolase family protein [Chloroflexota bacterium]